MSSRSRWGQELLQAEDPVALHSSSADAPVNVVPITQQSKDEQEERDQEQACCFRRINGVAMVLVSVIVLGVSHRHAHIVVPRANTRCISRLGTGDAHWNAV